MHTIYVSAVLFGRGSLSLVKKFKDLHGRRRTKMLAILTTRSATAPAQRSFSIVLCFMATWFMAKKLAAAGTNLKIRFRLTYFIFIFTFESFLFCFLAH